MKTITILAHPTDSEDVRGYFLDEVLARAVGRAIFPTLHSGAKPGAFEHIKVYETAEEYLIRNPTVSVDRFPGILDKMAVVRARALAKLTIEECEALGLGPDQGFHTTVLTP